MSETITPQESTPQTMPEIVSETNPEIMSATMKNFQENSLENKLPKTPAENVDETVPLDSPKITPEENLVENLVESKNAEMSTSDGEQNTDLKWYILQSYAGQEKKAHELILFHTQMKKMEKLVDEIFIPSEEITTKVKGKERKSTSTYYPGYILIKMRLTDAMWHLLQQIPKVSGFIGKHRKMRPEAVPESQIEMIKQQIQDGVKQTQVNSTYQIGQNVRIIEGPFSEFVGHIDQLNTEKNSLVVLVRNMILHLLDSPAEKFKF